MIYPEEDHQKVVESISKIFLNSYNRKFSDFLDITLAALEEREEDYMEIVKRIDKQILIDYCRAYGEMFRFFYMDQKYWDILGEVCMRVTSRSKMNGEFYTPFHICRFMAAVLDPKPGEKIMDPCVGSGAMLLAVKEYWWISKKVNIPSRELYGMDISSDAIKMAKIQDYLTDYTYMGLLLAAKIMEMEKKGCNNAVTTEAKR